MKHPSMPRFAVSAKSVFLVLLLLFSIPALQLSAATDGDGDGIDDALDDCEFAAGNSTIDFTGCPDQDGDGNPDFIGVNYPAWNDSSRELYHSGGDSRAVTWSPDGMYIAGAGGGDVNLYWVGGLLTVLHTIDENVRALKFSPNGSYLAVGGYEEDEWENRYGWMLVLEMNWASLTATVIQNLSSMHPDTDVPSLAWSSNGSYLYTGADNEIRRFSVHDNWMMDMNYSYYSGNVWALDTSPDDRLIAGISGGGELKVYWAENGTSYMEFNNHTGSYALGLEFSPDGRWLLTGGFDNMVNIYNVSNKSLHDSIMVGSDVYGISFHPKGSHFIVARQSSSTLIYDAENWELSSSFGSFGSSNNNRGLRAVEWSPSEYAIAFGQRRDRITTYVVDEGYMQISGGELTYGLEEDWRQEWQPNHGKLVGTQIMTSDFATIGLCSNNGILHASVEGASTSYVSEDANYSSNGQFDCLTSTDNLLEIPIGRVPMAFAVKQSGPIDSCLPSIGGLTTGQLRWFLSGSSENALIAGIGELPGLDISSVAPNDDADGIKEWSDISSTCPEDEIVFVHEWENKTDSAILMKELFCGGCQQKDSLYSHTNDRARFQVEYPSEVLDGLNGPAGDSLLGMVDLMYATNNPAGISLVPIVDNLTHGIVDALAAGDVAVQATYNNSRDGLWPVQSDYTYLVNSNDLEDKRSFIEWSLDTNGIVFWENHEFVRLSILDQVRSWAIMGHDKTWMLPDDDGDGVWDGDDQCENTPSGSIVDENGCAEVQLDDDSDGINNALDDCDSSFGNATQSPYVGCPDQDGDGYADVDDSFIQDSSQWRDSDSDGFGDNPLGNQADSCPDVVGNSTEDRFGCIDEDGDGWSNADESGEWGLENGSDAFPSDSLQWKDSDSDGYGDNYYWQGESDARVNQSGDSFIDDPSQWWDRDGDGFGDEVNGTNGDNCPDVPGTSVKNETYGCVDSDGDGYADSIDDLPQESTQWWDRDGDGKGDNLVGVSADQCPDTLAEEKDLINHEGCGPSERDSDYDGITDAMDDCPNTSPFEVIKVDPNGCAPSELDSDGDGVSDDLDWAPLDANQSSDDDEDGFGDNHLAPDGDDCPETAGTSTKDRRGCIDNDGDGYSDPDSAWSIPQGADWRSSDPTQWSDSDGDGYGDNWGNPEWNESRNSSWPGTFVPSASKPDKCPLQAYEYAQSDGCPPDDSVQDDESDSLTDDTSSGSDMTLMYGLAALGGVVVLGLVGAVVVLLRKPPPTRKRPTNEPELVNEEEPVVENVDAVTWVQSWEELPAGGEYLPADSDGTVWYRTLEGEHWRQEHDQSWSLWQG